MRKKLAGVAIAGLALVATACTIPRNAVDPNGPVDSSQACTAYTPGTAGHGRQGFFQGSCLEAYYYANQIGGTIELQPLTTMMKRIADVGL